MKTVSDYIKMLAEDAASTNVVSSGAIATKEVPIGTVVKRKPVAEADAIKVGTKNILANVYAPVADNDDDDDDDVTDSDSSDAKRHMFRQKQQQSQDM